MNDSTSWACVIIGRRDDCSSLKLCYAILLVKPSVAAVTEGREYERKSGSSSRRALLVLGLRPCSLLDREGRLINLLETRFKQRALLIPAMTLTRFFFSPS